MLTQKALRCPACSHIHLHKLSSTTLGLLLGTEAPVMTPDGVDFFFFFLFNDTWLFALQPARSHGIPNNVYAALVGLSGASWPLMGYDSVAHLIEETKSADTTAGKAMPFTLLACFAIGLFYLLALTLCIQVSSCCCGPIKKCPVILGAFVLSTYRRAPILSWSIAKSYKLLKQHCVTNKELVGEHDGHVAVTCVPTRGMRVTSPAIVAVTALFMAAPVSAAFTPSQNIITVQANGICRGFYSTGQLQLCQSMPNRLTLLLRLDDDQLGLHGSC